MLAIGVDLGATNVRVALGDEEGKIQRRLEEKTERNLGREGVSKQLIRMIHSLDADMTRIAGVGVGAIGPLDIRRGMILIAPNLPFNDIPIREPLEREFRCPIGVLNDASAAALGEKVFGAGRDKENLCFVTISSGIGCGALVDGRLLLGKDGNAHEIGHAVIDMSAKLRCGCGRWGHWEAYCSGNNLPIYFRLWIKEKGAEDDYRRSRLYDLSKGSLTNIDARMLYNSASCEDELCRIFLEDVGRLNAIGFANIIAAYDPELITVGGSVTLNNQDLVITPIKRQLGEFSVNRTPEICVTKLGGDVGLYGALAMSYMDH